MKGMNIIMKAATAENIVEVINSVIKDYEVTKEQTDLDFSEVGMDSISFIKMIVILEEEFNVEIPDSFLLFSEMNTVNKIKDILNSLIETDRG